LADADRRHGGPLDVGKSSEARASRQALSWCASGSGRVEVPRIQVEAR
jgi:hypothetical protein